MPAITLVDKFITRLNQVRLIVDWALGSSSSGITCLVPVFLPRHLIHACMGGAVASWLVRSPLDRAVWVRALVGDIVLCSWARHYSDSASLHPGAQRVLANSTLG